MKTYNAADVELITEWADKYFKVIALINSLFGGTDFNNPPSVPSFESEIEYQQLRLWFCKNHDCFIPIWADFCSSKGCPIRCAGSIDGMEYTENPFLYFYYPDNLLELAYTIGATSAADIWDPDKENAALIINANNNFSHIVLRLKYWIGEFADTGNLTR